MLLTKLVLHALHNYSGARRLAERAQEKLVIASLQLTGNLASVIKSQALSRSDEEQRQALLQHSLELYGQAFTEPLFEGSYWLGVNALALATCLGKSNCTHAHRFSPLRLSKISKPDEPPDFWYCNRCRVGSH